MYVYIFGLPSVIVKNLPDNAGDSRDMGLCPGSGRFPGGGNGNPLPWTEEFGQLLSMGLQRVEHD